MKKRKTKKGFTFIETILYVAISTIVIGALFSYGWNMISNRTKAVTMRDVSENARIVNEKLNYEIRMATDVDLEQSVLEGSALKLVLKNDKGQVVIDSNEDRITLTRNNEAPQFLASSDVRIRNLHFSTQVSESGKVQYVGFSFTAEAYYPQADVRFEYNYASEVESGGEIRRQ